MWSVIVYSFWRFLRNNAWIVEYFAHAKKIVCAFRYIFVYLCKRSNNVVDRLVKTHAFVQILKFDLTYWKWSNEESVHKRFTITMCITYFYILCIVGIFIRILTKPRLLSDHNTRANSTTQILPLISFAL